MLGSWEPVGGRSWAFSYSEAPSWAMLRDLSAGNPLQQRTRSAWFAQESQSQPEKQKMQMLQEMYDQHRWFISTGFVHVVKAENRGAAWAPGRKPLSVAEARKAQTTDESTQAEQPQKGEWAWRWGGGRAARPCLPWEGHSYLWWDTSFRAPWRTTLPRMFMGNMGPTCGTTHWLFCATAIFLKE